MSGRGRETGDDQTRSLEASTLLQARHIGACSPATGQGRNRNHGAFSDVLGIRGENAKDGKKAHKVSRLAWTSHSIFLGVHRTHIAKNLAPESFSYENSSFQGRDNRGYSTGEIQCGERLGRYCQLGVVGVRLGRFVADVRIHQAHVTSCQTRKERVRRMTPCTDQNRCA